MEFKEDIIQRIKTDFNEDSDDAIEILNNAISQSDYLNTDRVIRCIVFLAQGDLNKLKDSIEKAVFDTRDVMLCAEYENLNDKNFNYKRIRDFNNTFEKCTENVTE
jgi:hypothetical protein